MKADWNRSVTLENRLNLDVNRSMYQGRPIIHRDSPVDGGVSLGGYSREAIVVDSKKYSMLGKLYGIAKERISRGSSVIKAVYDTVKETMPIQNEEAVNELIRKYQIAGDQKVPLDLFLKEGVGVCRHDALTCAALLEMFKTEGYVRGKISVDRNTTKDGGHEWCRYTAFNGEVYILDVAQRYIGSLRNSERAGRWPYKRPSD